MSGIFEVKIENLPELKRAFREFPKIAGPILQRALRATEAVFTKHTRRNDPVPYRTGFLLASFRYGISASKATWGPTVKYAPFVEFGTRPHEIRPRNAKALSWGGASTGKYVTAASGRSYFKGGAVGSRSFATVVHHPGTKPSRFMERIVKKSNDDIDKVFAQAGDLITREIARQTKS